MAESIQMRFPADTEYIGAIRLAVSGVAGKLDYAVDEIEDMKSCVAEACLLILYGGECDGIDVGIEIVGGMKLFVSGVDEWTSPRS
jgi:anti-sigma regulatory factor (Ser/Thr protein kinase)